MNKVIYIGITCYLGQWHFTRGKQYDMYQHERSVYYIISDNDYKYYINKQVQEVHYAPSKGFYEDMEFQEGDEDVNAVCIN